MMGRLFLFSLIFASFLTAVLGQINPATSSPTQDGGNLKRKCYRCTQRDERCLKIVHGSTTMVENCPIGFICYTTMTRTRKRSDGAERPTMVERDCRYDYPNLEKCRDVTEQKRTYHYNYTRKDGKLFEVVSAQQCVCDGDLCNNEPVVLDPTGTKRNGGKSDATLRTRTTQEIIFFILSQSILLLL